MMRTFWILLSLLLGAVNANAQTPFYQGKTVTFIVGFPAGSYDDLWPRQIAQYLPKYIPGNPNVIVQNMPGAGSMIAANYVFTVVKPDGLILAGVQPALYFNQLVGLKEVKFDWPKFNFIGSPWQSQLLSGHAVGYALQNHRRRAKSCSAAEVWLYRAVFYGQLHPKLLNEVARCGVL